MPDFDPKSIPILDDIIVDTVDVKGASSVSDALPVIDASPVIQETSDDFADIPDADSEAFESALIDYDIEQTNHVPEVETSYEPFKYQQQTSEEATIDEPYVAAPVVEQPVITPVVDEQATPAQTLPEQLAPVQQKEQSTEIPSLQSITDEIVKQLIPDLEQQLRYLVQQALEDKLPGEIIKATQTKTPTDN